MSQTTRFQCNNIHILQIGPIDLALDAAETIAITGPSGCGKSLLLRALADLIPHEGDIYLDRRHVNSFSPEQWRQQVAYLPAESQWWYETIVEHFSTTELEYRPEHVNLPASALQWTVARCSTGEKQRLALLRLLARKPRVLLLDEPTANVDDQSSLAMEHVIKDYQKQHGCPIIWVAHDRQQLKRVADRVYRFIDNKLVEENMKAA